MNEQRCLNCGKIDEPFNNACRWCSHPFDAVVSETPNPIEQVVETATPIAIAVPVAPAVEPQAEVKPIKPKAVKKPAAKKK